MCNHCGNRVLKRIKLNKVDIEVTCPICGRVTYETILTSVAPKTTYDGDKYILGTINVEELLAILPDKIES